MTDNADKSDGTVKLSAVKPSGPKETKPMAKVATAPKAAVVKPVIVSGGKAKDDTKNEPKAKGNAIKKSDFFDRVMAKGDMKKNQAKPTIEAALEVISAALLAGEELHLPPLGKIKVQNMKDVGGGAKALTLKLRTPKEY